MGTFITRELGGFSWETKEYIVKLWNSSKSTGSRKKQLFLYNNNNNNKNNNNYEALEIDRQGNSPIFKPWRVGRQGNSPVFRLRKVTYC